MPFFYLPDRYYILLVIPAMLIALWAQMRVKSTFAKYSREGTYGGLTGAQAARRILDANGLTDVRIEPVRGSLTDHYDPRDKVVRLSMDVYGCDTVAAVGVAAHETGHAIQHAHAYGPLQLRSALVPVVSFASNWVQWIILIGLFTINIFPGLLFFGIVLFALTTLFSFVTLPVEIDASRRACAWLDSARITAPQNHPMAVDALRSAAYTYVVAALGSLATLVYYIMIFLGGSRDEE